VEVERGEAGRLELVYRVAGDAAALVVPPPAAPVRTDELWKTTCFEAFAQPAGGDGYLELNLAPSGAWAAYRFDGYRAGMAPLEVDAPRIAFTRTDGGCELAASLVLPATGDWRLGLTAVIEARGGAKSYWALAHAPGRPDFHHAAGFILALAEPDA
jgi:hypothetical protein